MLLLLSLLLLVAHILEQNYNKQKEENCSYENI